jgi:hypothetical protein
VVTICTTYLHTKHFAFCHDSVIMCVVTIAVTKSYLNTFHNYRISQLLNSPTKYTYSSSCRISLHSITVSYMIRHYACHHQGETLLQQTNMVLIFFIWIVILYFFIYAKLHFIRTQTHVICISCNYVSPWWWLT